MDAGADATDAAITQDASSDASPEDAPDASHDADGPVDAPGDSTFDAPDASVPCTPERNGICEGNVYVSCVDGVESRSDCSDPAFAPNNTCAPLSFGGGCAAGPVASSCAELSLSSCVAGFRLTCLDGWPPRYQRCSEPEFTCVPSTLNPGSGRCIRAGVDDPCPEEDEGRSTCVDNARVICDAGVRLTIPCGPLTCLDNGMGATMCAPPGESCDPTSFARSCDDESTARLCTTFGRVHTVVCELPSVCCADVPEEDACCLPPPD